jgi:hypothetical protein
LCFGEVATRTHETSHRHFTKTRLCEVTLKKIDINELRATNKDLLDNQSFIEFSEKYDVVILNDGTELNFRFFTGQWRKKLIIERYDMFEIIQPTRAMPETVFISRTARAMFR